MGVWPPASRRSQGLKFGAKGSGEISRRRPWLRKAVFIFSAKKARQRWLQPGSAHRVLRVASYSGDTLQAQVTILLHELGHVIGRIPEDSDSWDGRSGENTAEVLRHCKDEIRMIAKNRKREGD